MHHSIPHTWITITKLAITATQTQQTILSAAQKQMSLAKGPSSASRACAYVCLIYYILYGIYIYMLHAANSCAESLNVFCVFCGISEC